MSTFTKKSKQTPFQFFLEHAGFGYDPAKETAQEGKERSARALAEAEAKSLEQGCSYRWEIDACSSSADWIEDRKDGGKYKNPWSVWSCFMHDADGEILTSLHSIDFGRDGSPWSDPYKRVVEAELAADVLKD